MYVDVSVKEVVKDLLDVIDNEGGVLHGNRRALALLDAESADDYMRGLEEQVEETEYIIYNAEDWIDLNVSIETDKFESRVAKHIDLSPAEKETLNELLDDFTKYMVASLSKKAMIELDDVPKVYTT